MNFASCTPAPDRLAEGFFMGVEACIKACNYLRDDFTEEERAVIQRCVDSMSDIALPKHMH